MKRLKGPELKMPELRVPSFLTDLYHDLADRRLLPFVGLVIVAILAVPFLLGGESEEAPPPPEPIAGASGAANADSARLTVVQSNPGLRDYRKRLAGREPTDPFKQRYTGPVRAGNQLNGEAAGSSSGGEVTSTSPTSTSPTSSPSTDSPSSTPAPGGASDGDGTPGGDGAGEESDLRLFTFAADLTITRKSGKGQDKSEADPVRREGVKPPTALPGEKQQVVTYMGISPKTRNPLLLVSDDVTAIFGEAKCLSGSESCQLLEVEPGFPLTFVFGPNDARYKINVLKVEPVFSGKF